VLLSINGIFKGIYPERLMATIFDVAKKAGVSKATVSRALNNTAVVNAETKRRIMAAVEELNYTPSFLAKGMRNRKTNTFGIIIPDFSNLYYSEFLKYVEDAAKEHDYSAIICTGEMNIDREISYINYLLSRQVEGLIFCCYTSIMENRDFVALTAKKVPIVVMDQPSSGLPVSAVYADGFRGIQDLIGYLVGTGRKRIAMIRSMHNYPCSESRFRGYLEALQVYGVEVDEGLIEESSFTGAGGYLAAKKLLARTQPSAIVAVNDIVAIGVLKYLLENDYRVPQDIALAGFDNIPLSSLVSPQLTTVNAPVQEMAHEAINILIRKIENPRSRNRETVFDTEIVVRQSTELVQKDEIMM
jgi:DNA-binding LacI/PurR family transcriptional regulator